MGRNKSTQPTIVVDFDVLNAPEFDEALLTSFLFLWNKQDVQLLMFSDDTCGPVREYAKAVTHKIESLAKTLPLQPDKMPKYGRELFGAYISQDGCRVAQSDPAYFDVMSKGYNLSPEKTLYITRHKTMLENARETGWAALSPDSKRGEMLYALHNRDDMLDNVIAKTLSPATPLELNRVA